MELVELLSLGMEVDLDLIIRIDNRLDNYEPPPLPWGRLFILNSYYYIGSISVLGLSS